MQLICISIFMAIFCVNANAEVRDSLVAFFSNPTITGTEPVWDEETGEWTTSYTVTFDASGSYDSEPPIDNPQDCQLYPPTDENPLCYKPMSIGYYWDFGDGETGFSTSPSMSHTYKKPDFYNVTLWLRVLHDTSERFTMRTAVGDFATMPPTASTSQLTVWRAEYPVIAEVGQAISFSTSGNFVPPVTPNINSQEIHLGWDLGDGCRYNSGYFWVGSSLSPESKLFIWDGDGSASQRQRYNGSDWTYYVTKTAGTNCVATGSSVTHTYTSPGDYNIRVTGYELFKFTGIWGWNTVIYDGLNMGTIHVNTRPNAVLTVETVNRYANIPIGFSASSSTDANGEALSYAWDFGDGVTSSEQNPEHIYQNHGEYTVTLTVNDGYHSSDPVTQQVEVERNIAWLVPIITNLLN